jgi:hypothetical protein
LANVLRDHPEIEIISRDRADDYIKGAGAGAPQAVQVADPSSCQPTPLQSQARSFPMAFL